MQDPEKGMKEGDAGEQGKCLVIQQASSLFNERTAGRKGTHLLKAKKVVRQRLAECPAAWHVS